jgi:hypothetical protein
MSPEEAARVMAAGGPEAKRLKSLRTGAKTVNFGIPYGRGANSICEEVRQEGVECTPEEAQGWIDGYRDSFPDAWAFLAGYNRPWESPPPGGSAMPKPLEAPGDALPARATSWEEAEEPNPAWVKANHGVGMQ